MKAILFITLFSLLVLGIYFLKDKVEEKSLYQPAPTEKPVIQDKCHDSEIEQLKQQSRVQLSTEQF